MTKVLIAEDDRFLLKMGQAKLTKSGYDVVCAQNGEEAITKAHEENPDILLLDVIMPIKNGFEALKEIRAHPKLKNKPVIILSNLGQESDLEKGKELGATDYLIKSNVSIEEVLKIVQKYE